MSKATKSYGHSLDYIASLSLEADNLWEELTFGGYEPVETYDVEWKVLQAHFALVGFLELNSMPQLAAATLQRARYLKMSGKLLEGRMVESIEEARCSSTDFVWKTVEMCRTLLNVENEQSSPGYENILQLLANLAHSATRMKQEIRSESHLDDLAEGILVAASPDLNSDPTINLTDSYRQPDTEIPSLKALVEYKFLSKKQDKRRIIDEMQADIRNYAGHGFTRLVLVVGQTGEFFLQEKLRAILLKEPSSLERIDVIVIRI